MEIQQTFTAKFTGTDSLGFKKGTTYNLLVESAEESIYGTGSIKVSEKPAGKLRHCIYSSWSTFFDNWTNICQQAVIPKEAMTHFYEVVYHESGAIGLNELAPDTLEFDGVHWVQYRDDSEMMRVLYPSQIAVLPQPALGLIISRAGTMKEELQIKEIRTNALFDTL